MKKKNSFRINKYLILTKASMMESLTFRTSTIVSVIGNMIYLIVIYFLWKAIYASSGSDVVNGMTFYDTMVYLVLASALFSFMECYVTWWIGRNFQSGQIVIDLLRPMDFQIYGFFTLSGEYVINFCTTFLPTFIVVYFVTNGTITLGVNLIFFVLSVMVGVLINFHVDFFVGLICFYSQTIWGVNAMKEIVVALLSGAAIPLAFFPDGFRKFVDFLPFQAIYNAPLQILIDKNFSWQEGVSMLLWQLMWLAIMFGATRIFWNVSKKILTVNGG